MAQTYTLTEVANLLTVDPKSLRRWIEIEQYDLSNQTTPYDKRIKYLTEDQVAHLAKAHDRLWPRPPSQETPERDTTAGLAGAVKLLRAQVDAMINYPAQTIQLQRTIEQIEQQVSDLDAKYSRQMEQLTNALIAISDLTTRIQEFEQTKPASRSRSRSVEPASEQDITELEPGLVGAADFAELHGVNVGTAKSAWQSGRIPTRRGKWHGTGRNPITVALDAEGRSVFYQLYASNASFQACPDCPHGENTGAQLI